MILDEGRRTDLALFMLFSEGRWTADGERFFRSSRSYQTRNPRPVTPLFAIHQSLITKHRSSNLSPLVLQGRVHDLGRRAKDGSCAFHALLGGGRRTENGFLLFPLFRRTGPRSGTKDEGRLLRFSCSPRLFSFSRSSGFAEGNSKDVLSIKVFEVQL